MRMVSSIKFRGISRQLSTKSSRSSNETAAGKRRFFKNVGVVPVAPPWVSSPLSATAMDSPVSAGVDGSNSASGLTSSLESSSVLHRRLEPNVATEGWFGITLDGRTLKTPLGQTLALPSRALAWGIAVEWDKQETTLQPAQMPLMSLACTALDQTASARDSAAEHVLRYLPTDTTCYWADPSEDRVLHKNQKRCWEPIHHHCRSLFGSEPATAMGAGEGILMSRARAQKGSGLPHAPVLVQNAKSFVEQLDAWELTALQSITAESKSFLVGAAVITRGISSADAIAASRVEEEFQISNWGMVEEINCN